MWRFSPPITTRFCLVSETEAGDVIAGERSRTANGIVMAAQSALSRAEIEGAAGNANAAQESLKQAVTLGRSAGTPPGLEAAAAASRKLADQE